MSGSYQDYYGSGTCAGSNSYGGRHSRGQQANGVSPNMPNGYSAYANESAPQYSTHNNDYRQKPLSSQQNYAYSTGSPASSGSPESLSSQDTTVKPWVCVFPGCLADSYHITSFARKADLERHLGGVHGINRVLHDCLVPGCNRNNGNGLPRADKLREHLRERHGIELPRMQRGGSGSSYESQGSR